MRWKCDQEGYVSAILYLLKLGPPKVLTALPLQIQGSWQLSLLELPRCCVPVCKIVTSSTATPTVTSHCRIVISSSVSSGSYTFPVQWGLPLLIQHSRPIIVFKPFISLLPILFLLSLLPHYRLLLPTVLLRLLLPLPSDFLRVLCWNAGSLRSTSTELLHFLSSHPVDLICIQKSNLNSAFSLQILGFSTLRSDCTHSQSGILSRDATHASGGVIIFVRQGLFFPKLSASSLSLLDPYSDYVGVEISLSNSSSHSFLNVYAPSIRSSPTDGRTNSFCPSILSSSRNLFILGNFNCHHPFWKSKDTSDPRGDEVFDYFNYSDLLHLNDPNMPALLHRSSDSRSSPDIFFAPFFLALSCS